MRKFRFLLLTLFAIAGSSARAQSRFSAPVDSVGKTGFYRLTVSPLLSAISRPDLGDIRLLDEELKTVQFLLQRRPGDTHTANPAPRFYQRDSSDGKSYLLLVQAAPYPVGQLLLTVESPHFFQRKIRVATVHQFQQDAVMTTLRSGRQPSMILLPEVLKSDSIVVEIDNGDNPPLRISSVQSKQPTYSLVAWLDAGHSYRIAGGDAALTAPDYDLVYFRDSIPMLLPEVGYGRFESVEKLSQGNPVFSKQEVKSTSGKTPLWIWPVVAGAVAVMGFLAWRLLTDMKRKGL